MSGEAQQQGDRAGAEERVGIGRSFLDALQYCSQSSGRAHPANPLHCCGSALPTRDCCKDFRQVLTCGTHLCCATYHSSSISTLCPPLFFRYGLEFVRYVLYRKWLGRYPRVHLRGRVVSGEFEAKMQVRGRGTRQLLLHCRPSNT